MAEVDSSIPMAAGNIPGVAGQQMISMFDFAQKVRAARDDEQAQNALKQIFTNPENVDPSTGLPTQAAISDVMKVSPAYGMKLQDAALDQQAKQAQVEHYKTDAGKVRFDFMGSVAGAAYDAYTNAITAGKSEDVAIATAQQVRNDAARNNGGIVGNDVVQSIVSAPFDPYKAKALASTSKTWSDAQHDRSLERVSYANAGLDDPNAPPQAGAADSGAYEGFAQKMQVAENGTGDRSAQNPNSTATGNGQFIKSTWLSMIKSARPELVKAGMTDDQLLALRQDPSFSHAMTVEYAKKNGQQLASHGIAVTGTSLALAHRFGAGDAAKIVAAPTDTPMKDVVSSDVIVANPNLADKTTGQVVGDLTAQFGTDPIGTGAGGQRLTGGRGWTIMTDPNKKDAQGNPIQYRYNPNTTAATTLDGQPYEPSGAQKLSANPTPTIDMSDPGDAEYVKSVANYKIAPPSQGRNPAYREAILKEAQKLNPDYQEGRYAASVQALKAFGSGKQGDTARSLNVSVSHLETLRELGRALDNGDVTLINAAKQRFAEEFGVPAPTNFDAARAIVADEVAKGVIGGQTAQNDRETLADSLKRERSFQAINGAIGTFQSLLGGQLRGLRDQYKRTTFRNDFDETFLSEDTRKALGVPDPKAAAQAPASDVTVATSKAEYDALKPGSKYRKPSDPDGTVRVKS